MDKSNDLLLCAALRRQILDEMDKLSALTRSAEFPAQRKTLAAALDEALAKFRDSPPAHEHLRAKLLRGMQDALGQLKSAVSR